MKLYLTSLRTTSTIEIYINIYAYISPLHGESEGMQPERSMGWLCIYFDSSHCEWGDAARAEYGLAVCK